MCLIYLQNGVTDMANLGVLPTVQSGAIKGSLTGGLSAYYIRKYFPFQVSASRLAGKRTLIMPPVEWNKTSNSFLYKSSPLKTVNYVSYYDVRPVTAAPIGKYKIIGTVRVEGVYLHNIMLNLYRRDNGLLVGTTATDSTGNFEFLYIPFTDCTFFVMAFYNGFNAVVMDDITPVLM